MYFLNKAKNSQTKLENARATKNDEYYTSYETIENELKYYHNQLKDKHILLPCDYDVNLLTQQQLQELKNLGYVKELNCGANFSLYFENNKNKIQYKSLTISHFNPNDPQTDIHQVIRDFKLKIGNEVGVVITNPPFSLFTSIISVIDECNLEFLLLGNQIMTKKISELFYSNKATNGYNFKELYCYDKNLDYKKVKLSFLTWYTNLKVENFKRFLIEDNFKMIKNDYYFNELLPPDVVVCDNLKNIFKIPKWVQRDYGLVVPLTATQDPRIAEYFYFTSQEKKLSIKLGNETFKLFQKIRCYRKELS